MGCKTVRIVSCIFASFVHNFATFPNPLTDTFAEIGSSRKIDELVKFPTYSVNSTSVQNENVACLSFTQKDIFTLTFAFGPIYLFKCVDV